MGMFMSSVAFFRTRDTNWSSVKATIEDMFKGLDGLVDNLDSDGSGFAILSPYGDMGQFLAELPAQISKLTGSYAVYANCVDSDFSMLEIYHNGILLEASTIGEVYEEFSEFCEVKKPDFELWKHLLLNEEQSEELKNALYGNEVFVEDQLRALSRLTGLPIFDDDMMMRAD